LNSLGSETHLFIRNDKVLRDFDPMISDTLTSHIANSGIKLHTGTTIISIRSTSPQTDLTRPFPKTIKTSQGEELEVDTVIFGVGRKANTKNLGLENLGIRVDSEGNVEVDQFQETSTKNIFAVGLVFSFYNQS
jgi:glutathione reductase (NADPH)